MKSLRSKLYPVGLLLNPATHYVPAAQQTVERLQETFARVRAQQAQLAANEDERAGIERVTTFPPGVSTVSVKLWDAGGGGGGNSKVATIRRKS